MARNQEMDISAWGARTDGGGAVTHNQVDITLGGVSRKARVAVAPPIETNTVTIIR